VAATHHPKSTSAHLHARAPRRPHRTCIFCGASLSTNRRDRDPWCEQHLVGHFAGTLDLRILWLLSVSWPLPVNLSRALDTDKDAVHRSVNRWRRRGVTIVGMPSVGYRLGRSL